MNDSAHYYTREGKAAHTQKTKPGAKNKTRPSDIRDAIRLGLLPSVTGVSSVLSNPQLQRWKERQIIGACYDVRPGPEESLEEYSDFIMERAFSQVKDAADVGTKGHAMLESYLTGNGYDGSEILVFPSTGEHVEAHRVIEPALALIESLNITVKETEVVVVNNEYGFGGTSDMAWLAQDLGSFGCGDYKFTKTKPGEPVKPKETHAMQLAAYVQTYWGGISDRARAFNLFLSTTEPGRVEIVWYDAQQLRSEWEAFKHCCAIWAWRSGYDPRQKAKEAA
jgi:hypothetical protein